MTLAEMRVELGRVVKEMRSINDLAEKEKRAFSADEQAKYSKLEADCDRLETDIRTTEEREARATKLAEREAHLKEAPAPATRPTPGSHRSDGSAVAPVLYVEKYRFDESSAGAMNPGKPGELILW